MEWTSSARLLSQAPQPFALTKGFLLGSEFLPNLIHLLFTPHTPFCSELDCEQPGNRKAVLLDISHSPVSVPRSLPTFQSHSCPLSNLQMRWTVNIHCETFYRPALRFSGEPWKDQHLAVSKQPGFRQQHPALPSSCSLPQQGSDSLPLPGTGHRLSCQSRERGRQEVWFWASGASNSPKRLSLQPSFLHFALLVSRELIPLSSFLCSSRFFPLFWFLSMLLLSSETDTDVRSWE